MMLRDARGSNQRLKTNANFSAADGLDDDAESVPVVDDDDEDA